MTTDNQGNDGLREIFPLVTAHQREGGGFVHGFQIWIHLPAHLEMTKAPLPGGDRPGGAGLAEQRPNGRNHRTAEIAWPR